MNKFIVLAAICVCIQVMAQTSGTVMANKTTAAILWPTNFFTANSNALNQAVGGTLGGVVPVTSGGTGATNASGARVAFGLDAGAPGAVGTNLLTQATGAGARGILGAVLNSLGSATNLSIWGADIYFSDGVSDWFQIGTAAGPVLYAPGGNAWTNQTRLEDIATYGSILNYSVKKSTGSATNLSIWDTDIYFPDGLGDYYQVGTDGGPVLLAPSGDAWTNQTRLKDLATYGSILNYAVKKSTGSATNLSIWGTDIYFSDGLGDFYQIGTDVGPILYAPGGAAWTNQTRLQDIATLGTIINQLNNTNSAWAETRGKVRNIGLMGESITDADGDDWMTGLSVSNLVLSGLALIPTASDVAALQAYDGPASSILLTDTNRGGLFVSTTGLAVDNGVVFTNTGMAKVWKRVFDGAVDPRWFGADSSGATDSRNAFQAAFNAANTLKAAVSLPPGNYRICPAYIGAASAPIDMHKRPFIGQGGKLWWSLPDWYTFNYQAATQQVVNFTNVLNGSGTYQNGTFTAAINCQWNGKGRGFTDPSLVDGIVIDGGWGSSGAPTGVKTIAGVTYAETPYWTVFREGTDAEFVNCRMENTPGQFFVQFAKTKVHNCFFGEFGDQVFYNGEGEVQSHNTFSDNTVYLTRATTGAPGDDDHIFATYQEVIKLYGCWNSVFQNNYIYSSQNVLNAGFNLQAWPYDSGYMTNMVISGNTVIGANTGAWILGGTRYTDTGASNTVTAVISDNVFRCIQYPIILGNETTELAGSVIVKDNVLESDYTSSGAVIEMSGHPAWTNALSVLIEGNAMRGALTAVRMEGNFGNVDVRNNTWETRHTAGTSTALLSVYQGDSYNWTYWKRLNLIGNTITNAYRFVYTYSLPAYSGATAYTSNAYTFDDGSSWVKLPRVQDGTNVYYAAGATTGVAPPNAPWVAWSYPTLNINSSYNRCYATISLSYIDQYTAASVSPSVEVKRGWLMRLTEFGNEVYDSNSGLNIKTETTASLLATPRMRGALTLGLAHAPESFSVQAPEGSLLTTAAGAAYLKALGGTNTYGWKRLIQSTESTQSGISLVIGTNTPAAAANTVTVYPLDSAAGGGTATLQMLDEVGTVNELRMTRGKRTLTDGVITNVVSLNVPNDGFVFGKVDYTIYAISTPTNQIGCGTLTYSALALSTTLTNTIVDVPSSTNTVPASDLPMSWTWTANSTFATNNWLTLELNADTGVTNVLPFAVYYTIRDNSANRIVKLE